MPEDPPQLLDGYVKNFKTMLCAAGVGDLVLVSAIRKSDREPVALVCAVQAGNDEFAELVPFAVMCEGDPHKDFEDPTRICGSRIDEADEEE